jgi:hypothetical protein
MKVKSKPALYSVLSGCLWAMVGYGIAYSAAPIRTTPFEVGRTFFGGLVAAPLIGLLIGVISRKFVNLGRSSRVAVTLADLYLATWLFLLAAGIVRLLVEFSGLAQQLAYRALVIDPAIGTLWGLTYTGYFLVLWPLSYANHVLVARAWKVAGAT